MLRSASVSRFRASPLAGVFSGSEGIVSPLQLPGAQAWYDVSDLSSMRNDAGAIPSNGEGVKLISDKSGNSGVNVLAGLGTSGNYASMPDAPSLNPAGDFAVASHVMSSDYTGAAAQMICAHLGAAGNRAFQFYLDTAGKLNLDLSYDGTNLLSFVSSVAVGTTDLTAKHFAFTADVDNGAGGTTVTYYTGDDGSTWTQLGTAVTVAGTGTLFDSTAIFTIGANSAGTTSLFTGLIYRVRMFSGNLTGTVMRDVNFATAAKLAPSFTESSSNAATVTINTSGATGARISGARDLYQGTAANQPILTIAASGNYLTFDGSNDYLKAAAFSLSQPETVYFVGSQVTWGLLDDFYDGNADATMQLRQSTSTPTLGIYAGTTVIENSGLAVATNGIVSAVFNGASSAIRVNRTAAVTGNAGPLAANGFTLGAQGAGTNRWANITASEVLVYSGADSTPVQDAKILYLGRHNGIAV